MSPDPINYSVSDGKDDIAAWMRREREEDLTCRSPVIIEADVQKLNWAEFIFT